MSSIEEIVSHLYRIKIPIPKSPLKYLNSYFINGEKFNLIIDTGLNHKDTKSLLLEIMKDLGFYPENTRLFITHDHSDHCGLSIELNKLGMEVLIHKLDGDIINDSMIWEKTFEMSKNMGFSKDLLEETKKKQIAYLYRPTGRLNFTPIRDGDILDLGNFRFIVIHTPGHSPGHLCLYEKNKKIFISGDHVLKEITPNISQWDVILSQWEKEQSNLENYLKSLERIKNIDVNLVLPGHRKIFSDLRHRIEEIKYHHETRLKEVLNIVDTHPGLCAFEIASYMKWDINYKTWDEFPITQKWFATGEAQAHLKYLCKIRKIKKYNDNQGVIRYKLLNSKD